jgi:hypothetical protein
MPSPHISAEDDIRMLVEFYKDNVAYQRHHEDIRFKSSQLIIALTAALIAAAKFAAGTLSNYAIALFVVLLGLLGIAQVLKHTERADRHAAIARSYRKRIGELAKSHSASSVEEIHDEAASIHKKRAGWVYKMRARWFWLCMHILVVAFGVGLACLQYNGKL